MNFIVWMKTMRILISWVLIWIYTFLKEDTEFCKSDAGRSLSIAFSSPRAMQFSQSAPDIHTSEAFSLSR